MMWRHIQSVYLRLLAVGPGALSVQKYFREFAKLFLISCVMHCSNLLLVGFCFCFFQSTNENFDAIFEASVLQQEIRYP